jgi:hypothetical protein
MPMLVAVGMRSITEANLERHFLAGVIVEIEPEGVKPLLPERIGRRYSGVRIDRHRHDRRAGESGK